MLDFPYSEQSSLRNNLMSYKVYSSKPQCCGPEETTQPGETGQLCSATTCSITAVMVAGWGWGGWEGGHCPHED